MAEKTKKVFRGSAHGFNKEDVNEFILELSRKYTDAEKEYRERISALEAENEMLSSRLAEAEARAASAAAKAADRAPENPSREDAKKAAEALSEVKKIRSQLKKRVRELESKYGDVLPVSEKKEKTVTSNAPEQPAAQAEEKKASAKSDFESYLEEFRSSTSTLFREFDSKYGTKILGGEK